MSQTKREKLYGLKSDSLFKYVFSNKENLKLFLKDIFDEEITNVYYHDKEYTKENKNLRYGVSDLLIDTGEEHIIIEMQRSDLKNLEQRITMYKSRLYAVQNPGEMYQFVTPVKVLIILDYPYGVEKPVKVYEEIEKETKERFGNYGIIKIWNIKESLKEKGSTKYPYARLFSLDEYTWEEAKEILEETKKNQKLKHIGKLVEQYNLDYDMYVKLKEEENVEMTFEQATGGIRAYAREEGRIEGKKEGKLEGKLENQIEIATNLLLEGFDRDFVMKMTKLSEEQLEQLYKNCER